MHYKGFVGHIVYDKYAGQYYGRVVGMKGEHFNTFQASSMQELELAFRDLVDDYIDDCRDCGFDPRKLPPANA